MSDCYIIGQYQYNIYNHTEGEEKQYLCIKAVNYKSLVDYNHKIYDKDIKNYKLIPSLDILYQILIDGFTDKNKDVCTLKIIYNNKKDIINISLQIKFRYIIEEIKFNLISVQELATQQVVDNKMQYFNKRLTDLEYERKEINLLSSQVKKLTEKLQNLEYSTKLSTDIVNILCINLKPPYINSLILSSHSIYIPIAILLTINNNNFIIENDQRTLDYNINYKAIIDKHKIPKKHYFDIPNYLSELTYISISDLEQSDLKFIQKCYKLKELIIKNLTNLVDIKIILNFKVLEKLTITGCRKIKNLKLLEKCTSLEVLKVHSSINTGVFSEALSFRIEIVK